MDISDLISHTIVHHKSTDEDFLTYQPQVREAAIALLAEAEHGINRFIMWLDSLVGMAAVCSAHPKELSVALYNAAEGPASKFQSYEKQAHDAVPYTGKRPLRRLCEERVLAICNERADARALSGIELQAALDQVLADHVSRYPDLGLSFGYVGNASLFHATGHPHAHDDRSWRFFTRLSTTAGASACNVSFGSSSTAALPLLLVDARRNLTAWCDEVAGKLAAGELHRVAGGA